MKKYIKEIIILIIQLFMFYVFPLFAVPTDVIGMVFLIIIATFLLSAVIGLISKNKIKYFYPLVTAISFIPTIFIYYNNSAFVHTYWYLAISAVGLIIGTAVNKIINKNK